MDIQIKEVMTPAPHSIAIQLSLADALKIMKEHEIRHLPFRKGHEIVGIISERDIDFAGRVDKKFLKDIKIEDAFSIDTYIVSPSQLVSEVARTMGHRKIGCAIVIDKQDLVGVFTSVDACKLLGETLSGRPEQ